MKWQTKFLHHYSTAYHSQKGRPSSRDKPLQTSPRRIPCLCTSKFVPPVVSSLSLSNLVCGAVQPDNGKQDLPQVGTPNLLTPRERPALTKRGMSMCFPHRGGSPQQPQLSRALFYSRDFLCLSKIYIKKCPFPFFQSPLHRLPFYFKVTFLVFVMPYLIWLYCLVYKSDCQSTLFHPNLP